MKPGGHPPRHTRRGGSASHAKGLAASETAQHPPVRYSHSSSLARSAGHSLTEEAATADGGAAPWELLPPPSPSTLTPRHERDIVSGADMELYPGEYRLPLDEGFTMPDITHHHFHEHTGHIREASRRRGYTSASIADRPTLTPPSAGCFHFIGQVYDYVQLLAKHGLRIYQTSHAHSTRLLPARSAAEPLPAAHPPDLGPAPTRIGPPTPGRHASTE